MGSRIPCDELVHRARLAARQDLAQIREHFSSLVELDLSNPQRVNWPESVSELSAVRDTLRSLLNESQLSLLDLSLLSHLLLRSDIPPFVADWGRTGLDIEKLLPGINPDLLFTGRWVDVPVPTVKSGDKARVWHYLVGALVLPKAPPFPWPNWAADYLEPDAQDSILDAFTAAQTTFPQKPGPSLCALPLMPLRQKLGGRSAGLPMALGACSVLSGESLAPECISTGDVTPDQGKLNSVNREALSEKADAAAEAGFSLFLVPQDNHWLGNGHNGLHVEAPSDLRQAFRWATMYRPGREAELRRLQAALQSPREFVRNCAGLSSESIDWCRKRKEGKSLIRGIRRDSRNAEELARAMKGSLGDWNLATARALGRLIGQGADLREMAGANAGAAFGWCALNMALSNHFGDNRLSAKWRELATDLRTRAADDDPDIVTEFINICYVAERHNCYLFDETLPHIFLEEVKKREALQQLLPHRDYYLGGLYGTMAQNYGFCRNLAKTEEFVKKAQVAFGQGKWQRESQRENAYLVAAYLDAQKILEAEKALWSYINISSWRQLQLVNLRQFEHYYLARYLADAMQQGRTEGILRIAKQVLEFFDRTGEWRGHPWQLWAYNVARIALILGKKDLARKALATSVAICDDPHVAKPEPMVLLPLAALASEGWLTPAYASAARDVLRQISRSTFLSQSHFAPLLTRRVRSALLRLRKNEAHFFPFSYR